MACVVNGECLADGATLHEEIKRWVCEQDEVARARLMDKLGYGEQQLRELTDDVRALMRIEDVKVVELLGAGKNGVVALVCNDQVGGFVVKIFKEPRLREIDFEREYAMQLRFYEAGLAPQPLGRLFGPQHKFMLMARVTGGMITPLLRRGMSAHEMRVLVAKLMELLDTMCALNLVHQDLHWGNIAYANPEFTTWEDIRLQVIDFGFSREGKCDVAIDLACLIKSSFSYEPLRKLLVREYRARGYPLPSYFHDTFSDWDLVYVNLLNDSMREIGGPKYKVSKRAPRANRTKTATNTVVLDPSRTKTATSTVVLDPSPKRARNT